MTNESGNPIARAHSRGVRNRATPPLPASGGTSSSSPEKMYRDVMLPELWYPEVMVGALPSRGIERWSSTSSALGASSSSASSARFLPRGGRARSCARTTSHCFLVSPAAARWAGSSSRMSRTVDFLPGCRSAAGGDGSSIVPFATASAIAVLGTPSFCGPLPPPPPQDGMALQSISGARRSARMPTMYTRSLFCGSQCRALTTRQLTSYPSAAKAS
eukprot:CAMPEP_0194331494 /NCGR_PEP_ID=MMETSP0171-20130528/55759_1 /TAXON_ID=218684 /ORGANISM="Corethron pennatum, Strain L29A3" /LENGTH=216 /DNA_ID=CAMNT_0039092981 /DNA_START=554 /DNA_END=1201 /DNA_ORIENTATION=+